MTQKTGQLSAGKKSFYFFGMVFFLIFSILLFGDVQGSMKMAQIYPSFYVHAGLFGVVLIGSLFTLFMYSYRVFQPLAKQGWIKKKLVFTASASFIFGFLLTAGYPNTVQYVSRDMNYKSKTNLNNLYQACTKYWAANGQDRMCSKETVASPQYGFVQSDHILIKGQGTSKTFTATARHSHTRTQYTIDAQGNIVEKWVTF